MSPENFPPAEQLTDEEMIPVRQAFEEMMFTWNIGISLPGKLSVAFAYTMIVDSLNMKTNIVNSGQMHFDFCTGYAPDCVFKEYCPCLGYWNDPDQAKQIAKNIHLHVITSKNVEKITFFELISVRMKIKREKLPALLNRSK